jgi:hypothetical protein
MTLQLDKHRIAIRERDYGEVLDLALCVIRVYARPLLAALALGIAPLFAFNTWLLWDYRRMNFPFDFPALHMFYTFLLVYLEIPLATAPATLYLGEAVFSDKPDRRAVCGCLWKAIPQLVVYQFLLRPLSAFKPFLNEIILLERNPMRSKGSNGMSTARRSRVLHRNEGADLFAQGFFATMIGGLLAASIWNSIYAGRAFLVNRWEFDTPMYTTYFQVTLWLVIGYFCVVRFLNYLNLRIRHEGWDVELAMRAELARLTGGLA